MGMSASQARFIQLTARMSDLELEGQQINQQRLNLANQSSAIQEQALKIPVPTAPSTYDFMHDVYTGKDADGNKVTATMDDDGNVNVGMLQKNAPTLTTGAPAEKVEDQFEQADNTKLPEQGGRQATAYYRELVDHTVENPSQDILRKIFEKESGYGIQGGTVEVDQYETKEETYTENNETKTRTVPDTTKPKTFKIVAQEGATVVFTGKAQYTLGDVKTKATTGSELSDTYTNGDQRKIEYFYDQGCSGEPMDAQGFNDKYTTGYKQKDINNMCQNYYIDDKGTKLTEENFDKDTGKLKEGVQLFEKSPYEKIDGANAYEIGEVANCPFYETLKGDIDELIQRIKNYETNAKGGNPDVNLKDWRITVTDGGGIQAVKLDKDTEGNVTGATKFTETTEDASYVSNKADKSTIDPTTGIGTIKVGDKTIQLTKSQELDTDAYQAAEADYKNKKAEYDRAQEEANTKIKKLQTIDKQLELKLKRLDTERNALNTEIDAVKKVIQDNTDKSFKTFSG